MARALKIFMRGKSISQLQSVLQRMGYEIKDQKALFGVDTRDAVKSFQKQQGLKPTGIVDEALMKQMSGGAPAPADDERPSKSKMMPSNQKELDALVRLLTAKGVFSQEEWDKEKNKVTPSSLI
ncbi:peptidoglycan-binding domain-containing protein [Ghiorsea bivora]|uniref:peptidoglycan-binding domain-containing protein n=1 Tax=Ghiorsea bivora TaxID=1485545 RepID=UPI00056EEB9E|nr:peptidoglycan-binding domain-containing protein [Ghiorsea bivora]